MDRVEANLIHVDGENGPFRALALTIPRDYQVSLSAGQYTSTFTLFLPTDDDLRAIQFACGEGK